jgi:hypothetical protein
VERQKQRNKLPPSTWKQSIKKLFLLLLNEDVDD